MCFIADISKALTVKREKVEEDALVSDLYSGTTHL